MTRFLTQKTPQGYKVWFPYGTNWYQVLIPNRKSTNLIDDIQDETGESVYGNLILVLGPHENFNMVRTRPHDLNYKSLRFEFIDGESKTFSEFDEIILCE